MVLPLTLYVHSKYGPWRLEGSWWQAHCSRPHFIIRFKTVPFKKYSSWRSSRRAWRKRWAWARRTTALGAFVEGMIATGCRSYSSNTVVYPTRQSFSKHSCTKMLPPTRALRLNWHGTGHHAAVDSETIQPPRSAARSLSSDLFSVQWFYPARSNSLRDLAEVAPQRRHRGSVAGAILRSSG